LTAAATAFGFIVERLEKDGRLAHSWRGGQVKAPGTASDYANMIWAALRLLQATGEPALLIAAERWCATLDAHFWVEDGGGYAFTADDTADVIARMRSAHDDATPNANALMISNLVALGLLTGQPAYRDRAEAIAHAFAVDLGRNALGHCGLLAGFYDLIAPQQVIVIGTADAEASASLAQAMFKLSLPGAVQQVVGASATGFPVAGALAGKTALAGKPAAYACIGPTCSLPLTAADELLAVLREQRSSTAAS
jgi:uncharacterized protein YyaL (SSP411 family)